ncbi:uncharacterized protein LOC131306921 [Rhododendron vialii]|uniref:uncharacterized protein LOC131306921 n=1 Tax=Rhododendron vialii TaxID=182163 RepID=UPI00265DD607|nr:uncharacterized protein LOC131306921 [Rhododendron vialii]
MSPYLYRVRLADNANPSRVGRPNVLGSPFQPFGIPQITKPVSHPKVLPCIPQTGGDQKSARLQICDDAAIEQVVNQYSRGLELVVDTKPGKPTLVDSFFPSRNDLGDIGFIASPYARNRFSPLSGKVVDATGATSSSVVPNVEDSMPGRVDDDLPLNVKDVAPPLPKGGRGKAKGKGEAKVRPGWDPQVFSASLAFCSAQMIVVVVEVIVERKMFYASIVYGMNLARDRIGLWSALRDLPDERLEGFDESAASDFNSCLEDISMHDMVTKGFQDILHSSWNITCGRNPMERLSQKLRGLKPILKAFHKQHYSNLSRRVQAARVNLSKIQSLCLRFGHDQALCDLEKDLVQQFYALSSAEEAYKQQKSRVNWLALGDKNTKKFHQKMNAHRVRNTILSLVSVQGVTLDNPADIEVEILGEGLIRPVSEGQILSALKSIHRDKAPGPDEFNSAFFQDNWSIIKEDFVAGILFFFESGYMPVGWNSTAVTLVPKVSAPHSLKDYRPIACCNTVYKCITKVLATDFKQFYPEIVRGYHRDQGPPRCTIKLDIMKAYDSVDWDFLVSVMRYMEFPVQFIDWVRACVSTPHFYVVINGELRGFFPGRRGLRQGDPISPCLFLLVMEAFSAILLSRIAQGGFTYHPKCVDINLSHLAFADDMFISACFFAGVGDELKQGLRSILEIPEASLPVKYLGVPLISTKLRYSDCLMKEIESMLSAFLWQGIQLKTSGAKVAWSTVCTPKKEGCLGFKRLKDWNKASMLRHLWALCKKEDILWLFGLRRVGLQYIKAQIGNGKNTFLWLDNWHNLGPLLLKYGDGVTTNLEISLLILDPNLLPHPANEDSVIWTLSPLGCYSAKSAWEALRSSVSEVEWYHLVWHKRHVPRWSFIQWVSILGRLNTRDRLMEWGIVHDSSCDLCLGSVESHAHLFFSCHFSSRVWLGIGAQLGSFTHDWSLASEVSWGSHSCKNKSIWASLLKLCLAAAIYYIWRERNGRIFQQIGHNPEAFPPCLLPRFGCILFAGFSPLLVNEFGAVGGSPEATEKYLRSSSYLDILAVNVTVISPHDATIDMKSSLKSVSSKINQQYQFNNWYLGCLKDPETPKISCIIKRTEEL